jgi:hypothetical protein
MADFQKGIKVNKWLSYTKSIYLYTRSSLQLDISSFYELATIDWSKSRREVTYLSIGTTYTQKFVSLADYFFIAKRVKSVF